MANIRLAHGLGLDVGLGLGLVPSYYPVIVITIIRTYYVHAEQDRKIMCYHIYF